MKIVFMGTPDFAVKPLEALAASRHTVSLVVTQPDRVSGRGRKVEQSAVKQCAEKLGIPVYQPERVRNPEAWERLSKEQPDVIVVAAYGQILPEGILQLPRYGCINIHASMLPALRGAAPIQWAVLQGDQESGVTIMQMDKGLDTGDILLQEAVPITQQETAGSLYEKLGGISGPLILKALEGIEDQTITRTPQDNDKSSYARMLKKEDGRIDWSLPASVIERQVRGMNPWPSAFTFFHGRQLKIWKSHVAAETEVSEGETALFSGAGKRQPGTVVSVREDSFLIQCGDGVLVAEEVQLAGKKRMTVHDFLLGYSVLPGEVLGE